MLSFFCFVIAAVFFILAALSAKVGALLLVDWGLFFVALGLALGPATVWYESRKKTP
jgi:hypothetical protein